MSTTVIARPRRTIRAKNQRENEKERLRHGVILISSSQSSRQFHFLQYQRNGEWQRFFMRTSCQESTKDPCRWCFGGNEDNLCQGSHEYIPIPNPEVV